jgi:hypothetical protein
MMRDREKYIQVASLFGDVHRFLLLRSLLGIERILKERTDYFTLPTEQKTIWPDAEKLKTMSDQEGLETTWYFGQVQQYVLLSILMDTPVKLSYVGCSTGWFKEIDKKRGTPQLLVMTFEPIDVAMRRLRQFR